MVAPSKHTDEPAEESTELEGIEAGPPGTVVYTHTCMATHMYDACAHNISLHILTLTHQNLLFCRVPIKPMLRFITRTYKKVGFGRLR